MELVLTFFTVLLGCVAGIAIYNWIRAELDEREWRRILKEEGGFEGLHTYRLVATEDKDSDRE
jgi:DMSO reductase anchor subunit